jgi:hypothetical protein
MDFSFVPILCFIVFESGFFEKYNQCHSLIQSSIAAWKIPLCVYNPCRQ